MSRIYDTKETIDGKQVQTFFNSRAKKEANAVDAVMLQSAGSTLATDRDKFERENLLPRLDKPAKVVELGCGAGRLAPFYGAAGHQYLGLDFSDELIARANAEAMASGTIHFQVAEVPYVKVEELKLEPPFDMLVVTGLMIYLNDEAVLDSFKLLAQLAAPKAKIYVRESLSDMDIRLTLKEHFSDELDDVYNAIYRTTAELKAVMDDTLIADGFRYDVCGEYAFPPALRNRTETTQRYFTLTRD